MNYELFYHEIGRDDLTAKEHSHMDCIEVIHIVNGHGTILLGTQSYPFSPNDVFCFDGSLLHYILPEDEQTYERNKLIFAKSMLSVLANDSFGKPIYFHAEHELAGELDQCFHTISKTLAAGDTLLSLSFVFHLLHICKKENTHPAPSENVFLQNIMSYINLHLQDSLSIEFLAKHVHMSKYHMCRQFKKDTGITIGNYIRNQRIYLAKKRLEETSDSISTIALECGFGDLAHFTKQFKSIVKVTPSGYRKLVAEHVPQISSLNTALPQHNTSHKTTVAVPESDAWQSHN